MVGLRFPNGGRFSGPALLILISLTEGDKHGYALIEDIECTQRVRLGPGTLYAAIARLEAQGLIEPVASSDRRRPYSLTVEGRRILREQLIDLQCLATVGLERLSPL